MIQTWSSVFKTSRVVRYTTLLGNQKYKHSTSQKYVYQSDDSYAPYSSNEISSELAGLIKEALVLETSFPRRSIETIKSSLISLTNNLGSQCSKESAFINECYRHYIDSPKSPNSSPNNPCPTPPLEAISLQRILHAVSIQRPYDFWFQPYTAIYDSSEFPRSKWYAGGKVNVSYSALDAQVIAGRGEKVAIYWDSPVTCQKKKISYNELLDKVKSLSYALRCLGVEEGDFVMIYMPVIPEAVVSMLACARIGAIHSAVFGGFGKSELTTRIDAVKPKVILVASCGIEINKVVNYVSNLDAALLNSKRMNKPICVVLQRKQGPCGMSHGSLDWDTLMRRTRDSDCLTPVPTSAYLYSLFTSGSTGEPKGVVRDHVGQIASSLFSMRNIFDFHNRDSSPDVFLATSDLGWVLGHSLSVYGPLITGSSTVLFEGKPVGCPDEGVFWRLCEEYGVKGLFTTPTALRAIRERDPEGKRRLRYDLSKLETIWLAGERIDQPSVKWLDSVVNNRIGESSRGGRDPQKTLIVDNWWQTETGWPVTTNMMGLADSRESDLYQLRPNSSGLVVPGWDLQIIPPTGYEDFGDSKSHSIDSDIDKKHTIGSIVLKLPLPPGALVTLQNGDQKFVKTYLSEFDGFFDSKDIGYIDEDGYVHVLGRKDDVINVASHRLSTMSMEVIICIHPNVKDNVVIGVGDQLKGEVPVGFVVLDAAVEDHQRICKELVGSVRSEIGPIACFRNVIVVKRLPRNRSGKVLRGLLKSMYHGRNDAQLPDNIDDASAYDTLKEDIRRQIV